MNAVYIDLADHALQNIKSGLADLERILPKVDEPELARQVWRALSDATVDALALADKAATRCEAFQLQEK